MLLFHFFSIHFNIQPQIRLLLIFEWVYEWKMYGKREIKMFFLKIDISLIEIVGFFFNLKNVNEKKNFGDHPASLMHKFLIKNHNPSQIREILNYQFHFIRTGKCWSKALQWNHDTQVNFALINILAGSGAIKLRWAHFGSDKVSH